MENHALQFEDFLLQIPAHAQGFAEGVHARLTGMGYRCKIESKPSGVLVSYGHPKSRRVILNFLARKKGVFTRIYGDNHAAYADFLRALPQGMEGDIRRAANCKRLRNPEDCNSRCPMGYDFFVGDTHYQKCRYSCFQFLATPESIPVIGEFVERELAVREGGAL